MNLHEYRKTIVAVIIGVLGWAGTVVVSEHSSVSAAEWLGLATAVATALGVYGVPNDPHP